MPQWVKDVAKALSSAALAGIAAATTALVGDGKISAVEWLAIAAAVIYGGYGTYWTPDSMSPLRKAINNGSK